jgi:hypothetical protein
MKKTESIVPVEKIGRLILVIRGQRVMLDSDLAEMYGVPTKVLNQAVRRNLDRFPADFMFKLNNQEVRNLRSQFVTSNATGEPPDEDDFAPLLEKAGRGGRRYLPYVFTEHGAIMAANVLNSDRAVQASVYVVRAFVKLREFLSSHKEMGHKLKELEARLDSHDDDIRALVSAIRQLMAPPAKPRKRIGFRLK